MIKTIEETTDEIMQMISSIGQIQTEPDPSSQCDAEHPTPGMALMATMLGSHINVHKSKDKARTIADMERLVFLVTLDSDGKASKAIAQKPEKAINYQEALEALYAQRRKTRGIIIATVTPREQFHNPDTLGKDAPSAITVKMFLPNYKEAFNFFMPLVNNEVTASWKYAAPDGVVYTPKIIANDGDNPAECPACGVVFPKTVALVPDKAQANPETFEAYGICENCGSVIYEATPNHYVLVEPNMAEVVLEACPEMAAHRAQLLANQDNNNA